MCNVLLLHDKDNDGLFEVATSNIRLRLKQLSSGEGYNQQQHENVHLHTFSYFDVVYPHVLCKCACMLDSTAIMLYASVGTFKRWKCVRVK